MKKITLPKKTSDTGGDIDRRETWEEVEKSKSMTEKQQLDFYFESLGRLSERTKEIEEELLSSAQKAVEIKEEVDKSEKRIEKTSNFMMTIAGVIIIAFFLSAVPIYLDYLKNNYERYVSLSNNLEDSINELKIQYSLINLKVHETERKGIILNNMIKNDTINKSEKEYLENNINQQQAVLDCLKEKKYWQYEQCFK